MSTDLVKFEEGVKSRVKQIVGELIPEPMYDSIVQRAIQDFKDIDIPKIVKAELEAHYRAKIKEALQSADWVGHWNNSSQELASEMVKKILIAAAPEIFANFVGASAQQIVNQLRYH